MPLIATLTLNRQTTAPDGTLTVDAIYVSLLNSTQTLTIGTSVCNTANLAGVLALPRMATPIGATLAGLVSFGGVGLLPEPPAPRRVAGLTAYAATGPGHRPGPVFLRPGRRTALGRSAQVTTSSPAICSLAVPSPYGQGSAASRAARLSSPIS